MGRDVGRDEGREQAEWRDLVARLELPAPVDPDHAPWPERENLGSKTQRATGTGGDVSTDTARDPADQTVSAEETDGGRPDGAGHDDDHDGRGPADRSRVIRPAGTAGVRAPNSEAPEPAELADPPAPAGPRDYELDEARDDDLDGWDDHYVPPPVPPQPKLDPVAKGAWIALFGGPGYLLIATLLGWQIAGWAALTAVAAFVTGFVVLVIRLGDGPSKRDGPDQGAVV